MSTPETPVCGAKTRAGTACQKLPEPGKRRCRMHGGAKGSGAPGGERNGNYRHGRQSRAKQAERAAAMNKLWKPLPPPYRPWLDEEK